jgi:hypothetical protein
MNKTIELQEIKKQIAQLTVVLEFAKSNNASPVVITALENSILGLANEYIATL